MNANRFTYNSFSFAGNGFRHLRGLLLSKGKTKPRPNVKLFMRRTKLSELQVHEKFDVWLCLVRPNEFGLSNTLYVCRLSLGQMSLFMCVELN